MWTSGLGDNREGGIYKIEHRRRRGDSEWSLVVRWPSSRVAADVLGAMVLGVIGDDDWALDATRNIRAEGSQSPILVLRRSSGSVGAAALLNAGADYCHAHDCTATEIEAVVRALARRGRICTAAAEIEIDEASRSIFLDGARFEFGPVAFLVMRYLVVNRDRWVSQREIIERAIATHYRSDSAVARVQIFQIRKVLGSRRDLIRRDGKRGCGYMFTLAEPVDERESGAFPIPRRETSRSNDRT